MKFMAAAALALSLSAHVFAQAPTQQPAAPPSTGAISGVVVDGVSKEPIEDVTVALNFSDGKTTIRHQQLTDVKGRFVFVNLPAGDKYTFTASAPGYVDSGYSRDASRPFTTLTNVALNTDQWISDLSISLWRPGSITGRVLDEAGEPMVGVFVRALKRERAGGRDIYTAGHLASTDDTGAYRLNNLDPGEYVVNVPSVSGHTPAPNNFDLALPGRYPWRAPSPDDRRPMGYAPTFYPAARTPAEAQQIELGMSQVRAGVDVTLRAVPLFRVSGTVPGTPFPLALRLVPDGSETLGVGGDAANTMTLADGSFIFENVPAGSYAFETGRSVLQISSRRSAGTLFGDLRLPDPPRGPNGPFGSTGYGLPMSAAPPDLNLGVTKYAGQSETTPAFLARTPIAVGNTDITGLVVPLESGASFSGRVIWDTDPGKPELKPSNFDQSLTLEPAGRNPNHLRMIDTTAGIFKDSAVNPGEYFIRKRGAVGTWLIKSVMVDGADRSTKSVDLRGAVDDVVVTLTSRGAAIIGSVRELHAAVIAFPQDQTQWDGYGFNPPNMRAVDTATNGTFTIDRLPAGDYFIVAVDPAKRNEWLEEGFFAAAASRATRVSVAWGETKNASLGIATVRR